MYKIKPYSVYIVEDEYYSYDKIKRYVHTRNELELKGHSNNAGTALKDLKTSKYDLLFLDINLGETTLTGFDLINGLENPPFIIYTTGYSKYAGNAVDHDNIDYLIDYLLKPFTLDRFNKAVNRFLVTKQKEELLLLNKKLRFKQHGVVNFVELNKILYIKSKGRNSIIHTLDTDEYTAMESLKDIHKNLPAIFFMRIHKQYIVNLSYINQHYYNYSKRQDMVILINNVKLKVGEKYRSELKIKLEEYYQV